MTHEYVNWMNEMSGSHGGEYVEDCRPDDRGSKHLWNIGQFLPDYTM
jgi:hypothetical protein